MASAHLDWGHLVNCSNLSGLTGWPVNSLSQTQQPKRGAGLQNSGAKWQHMKMLYVFMKHRGGFKNHLHILFNLNLEITLLNSWTTFRELNNKTTNPTSPLASSNKRKLLLQVIFLYFCCVEGFYYRNNTAVTKQIFEVLRNQHSLPDVCSLIHPLYQRGNNCALWRNPTWTPVLRLQALKMDHSLQEYLV